MLDLAFNCDYDSLEADEALVRGSVPLSPVGFSSCTFLTALVQSLFSWVVPSLLY